MRTLWCLGGLALAACDPLAVPDPSPPRLVDTTVTEAGQQLNLEFDKPVVGAKTDGDFGPSATRAEVAGSRVSVPLPPGLKPGTPYHWRAEVEDSRKNVTSVTGRFYGPNDHPATMRLNEVRVAGSGKHGDFVELRVEAPGNLGGWTLDAYTDPKARVRFVFPDREVVAGAMVVLHYKPTGIPGEVDEVTASDASTGAEAEPSAWDFWVPHGKGLSAVTGVVALRPAPGEPPSDALVYSKKPGEGVALARAVGWPNQDEFDPQLCTATRTWSRTDDQPGQWILTANGGATPGRPNKVTPWAGSTSNRKSGPKTKG